MQVLGLSGKKGSGKDTVCAWLIEHAGIFFPGKQVVRIGIADRIKEMIIHGWNVPREVAYGDDAAKEMPLPYCEGLTVRDACKVVGTAFANAEPNHWVRHFITACKLHEEYSSKPVLVVCTDVRFPKEVHAIQGLGGKVIRLSGGKEGDKHVSETALDSFCGFDVVVKGQGLVQREHTLATVLHQLKTWGWAHV